MKILQVVPYYPPRIGGIQNAVATLSRTLVQAGHEVSVYTSNVPRNKTIENVDGVDIIRLGCPIIILNNPIIPSLAWKMISGEHFDVVHIHGYFHLSSNIVTLCRMFRHFPLILTSHGTMLKYKGAKGALEKIYHETAGKWMLKNVDRIISLSPGQTSILISLGADPNKVVTIPNGIEFDKIKAETSGGSSFRKVYCPDGNKIILFAGSVSPIKGIDCLISAVKYVKTKSVLVVAGGDHIGSKRYRQNLERMVIDNGLQDRVIFTGYLSKEKLAEAYRAADLFVLPSLAEGLPLVLLEAMSHGKCVIASNIPGNSDIIKHEDTGLLFQPGNSQELSEKIDYLLRNEDEQNRLGTNARCEVERKYRWENVLEHTLAVYRDTQRKAVE